MPRLTTLPTDWTLTLAAASSDAPRAVRDLAIPATVPGCVHTDLMAAGLLDDPYLDANEDAQHWIGRSAWEYTASVDAAPGEAERIDLVAEGLDTVATVAVNDVVVGTSRNMHRSPRFDVRHALSADGRNDVRVRFDSVWEEAERMAELVGGHRGGPYGMPYNMVRKMACNFGWDWGPTLVTAGIWKPMRLHAWSVARLDRVRPLVTMHGDDGVVEVKADVERSGVSAASALVLRVRVDDHETTTTFSADENDATAVIVVPTPRRWHPRGYGDQPLSACTVTLETEDGGVLDTWERRLGFRDVVVDTSLDDDGRTRFTFIVNGEPIFARGVNWIPDDCFPHRVDEARYRRRLQQACDAGVDLIRVWGGGLYESDTFYDICDEMGLLVWQDFLFACAAYPEEEPFRAEVEAEAREVVARLMPHPSLVLWNGNNENNWGLFLWSLDIPLGDLSWGEALYRDLLPTVVAEVDPTRAYWVSSPWSGSADIPPNDPDHGNVHVWDVWNGRDYTAYRDYSPPFVSEFGWQAPPVWATLRRAVSDSPLTPDSPGVMHHQKAKGGNSNLMRGLAFHFPEPASTDDWHHLTQVNQARALTVGIEHWRAQWPRTAGSIVWQLNDCWPVASWAVIDGDGRLKPAWYALRRAYADRLVTVQPTTAGMEAALVNQSADMWRTEVVQRVVGFDGLPGEAVSRHVSVPGRSVVRIPIEVAMSDARGEVLVVEAGPHRDLWFGAEDTDLRYAPDALDTRVAPIDGGWEVTLTARALTRDIVIHADRLDPDAVVDDAQFTMLAGETRSIRVHTSQLIDGAHLVVSPVLATVNDAVHAARGSAARGDAALAVKR